MDGNGGTIPGARAYSTSSIATFRVITGQYTTGSTFGTSVYRSYTREGYYTGTGVLGYGGSAQIQVGGRTWGGLGSRLFAGDVGEVLVYNRFLTSGELVHVVAYLKNKWGL